MKFNPLLAGLALAAASAAASAGTPSHLYTLDTDLADSMAGPALTANGGLLGGGGYSFGTNQGLSLSGVLGSQYSIDFSVTLDSVAGYRKLVDFKDLASDDGFYAYNNLLNFYPVANSANPVLSAGVSARITLTRDASGLTTGYVNGAQQWQFDDSATQRAVFSTSGNVAHFFRDDATTGFAEASAGKVDYIALYDHALSAAEVGQISAVPEPGSYTLMLGGLAAVAAVVRRRRAR